MWRPAGGVAVVVVVLAGASSVAAPAGGAPRTTATTTATTATTATATISTHDVDRGGIVTFTGACGTGAGGDDLDVLLRVFLVSGQPGAPFDVSRTVPLPRSTSFVADLGLPADVPPGQYQAQVECFAGDVAFEATVDQPDLTVEATAVDPGGEASLVGPATEVQDALVPFTVTCPASTPGADVAVVTGRALVGGVTYGGTSSDPLDASGHASVPLLGPIGGPPGSLPFLPAATYELTLLCQAGTHILRAGVVRPLTITSAPTTTVPTTASPSTSAPATTAPATTAPVGGSGAAPGATPVEGTSRFTG